VAYTSRNAAAENRKIPKRPKYRADFRSLWPPNSLGTGSAAAQATLAWTNWPLLTVGLVARGYSDDDVRKIIGGNVLRVIRDTQPES